MWYIGDEPGVDGWWVELVEVGAIKGACPAVDQGRNPAGGWLPVSGATWPEAKGPRRRGETTIIPGCESSTICGYFFFFPPLPGSV